MTKLKMTNIFSTSPFYRTTMERKGIRWVDGVYISIIQDLHVYTKYNVV